MTIAHFQSVLTSSAQKATLQGTTSSPVVRSKTSIDPDDAVILFTVAGIDSGGISKGYIESAGYNAGDSAVYFPVHQFAFPVDYADSLWVRVTSYSGDAPTLGITLNTWYALAGETRTFGWTESGALSSKSGIAKVELSTDSGGSNIVATGYYQGTASVET